jgi:hypothetical protein
MHAVLTFGKVEPLGPEVPPPDIDALFQPLDGGEGGRFSLWATPHPALPPSDLEVRPGAGRIFGDYEAQRERMQARIGDEPMLSRPEGLRPFLCLWRITGKQAPDEVNAEHQKNTGRVFPRIVCAVPLRPAGSEGALKYVVYLYEAADEAEFRSLYENDAAVQFGVVEATPCTVQATYPGRSATNAAA